MDVNRGPPTEREPADRPTPGGLERLVRTANLLADVRVALAIVVAVLVCFPILVLTTLGASVLSQVLAAIGLPPAAQGILILVVGLGGGLGIGFVVLLRILRRLPRRVRQIAFDPDESPPPDERPAPMSSAELAALDARLAGPPSGARERPSEQPDR
jgi:hypothetical protein